MLYNNYWIVCDLESGGFSCEKNPVTEIACVILDYQLNVVKEYETLVKPYGDLVIERQALEVTGLSLDEINKGKESKQVVLELIDLFKPLKVGKYTKPILVGHNFEKFDLGFLVKLFQFYNKNLFDVVDSHVEDTLWDSRKKWGHVDSGPDFKLGTCCSRAGIELVQAHRALADTQATAKLFISLMKSLRGEGISKKVEEVKKVRDSFKF